MRYEKEGPNRRVRIEDVESRYGGTYPRRTLEIRCCRVWLSLDGFTNTCEGCGGEWNQSGQALAPREQWGEETGEHPADIARIK